MPKTTDPRLCDFNKITLIVPRYKLIKLLMKKSYLTAEETIFLRALHWKTEAANNKILHVQSLVEKALLKASNYRV